MTEHVHDWKPVKGWQGRYRCDSCMCFGYRGVMVGTVIGRNQIPRIIPYICTVKHCDGWAVGKYGERGKAKRWKCSKHKPGPPGD